MGKKLYIDNTLIPLYLKECDGDFDYFQHNLSLGQRLGQAFFNSLSQRDQAKLKGSLMDPFHWDDDDKVVARLEKVIERLLDSK